VVVHFEKTFEPKSIKPKTGIVYNTIKITAKYRKCEILRKTSDANKEL